MDATKCPKCGSHDTDFHEVYDDEAHKGAIYIYCHCEDCGIEYVNVYRLAEQVSEEDY